MKKLAKQLLAVTMTAALLAGALAGCNKPTEGGQGTPAPSGGANPPVGGAASYPITPEELGSGTVKWAETTTKDGWNQVTNEGGATLGYSPDSGIKLIQVDGLAFKDLNKNGQLDGYEDWRQDADARAADLAGQMSGEEIAPLATHGGWSYFGEKLGEDDLAYIKKGGRDGVTRSSTYEGNTATAVKWTNAMQAAAEAEGGYGIPLTISVDPHNISNTIDQLGLAATMNAELAHKIGVETAKQYRAVGVTMLLGPQIDLIGTPVWNRGNAAYSDDPALARDIAAAFIDGLQSTYDESGSDLGWGGDSVIAIAKHFAGAGASEGGRNDHDYDGKYSVFPGNSFDAHLIPFFDGAFRLPGKTESSAGVMTNYAVLYTEDGSLGELVGGAYSEYRLNRLKESGFDGFILTDWGILSPSDPADDFVVNWGMEDLTTAECFARLFELGIDQVGGSSDIDEAVEGYGLLAAQLGEETAMEHMRSAAQAIFTHKMNVGIFDNPYLSTEHALATTWSEEAKAFGDATQQESVIMLKNSGNAIAPYDAAAEKQTVYIPYTIKVDGNVWSGYTYSCEPSVDLDAATRYYNVVTDTVGQPTGTDENGETIYTAADIIRASAQEIAACDLAIVKLGGAMTASTYDADAGLWLPPSLQYEAYTADSQFVRQESLSGDMAKKEISSAYGTTVQEVKENRSYYGNTAPRPRSYGSYETLQFVSGAVSDRCKVVAIVELTHASMVWSEVEPLADAIFVRYKDGALFVGESQIGGDVMVQVIAGEVEPSALLPAQQPASMEAVEKQLEDVPRDMECYVDSAGNTYDFAYGMNWSGVISDARTAKYAVPPLVSPGT